MNRDTACDIRWIGEIDYKSAVELQSKLAAERLENSIPDTLLLLEHPPTITIGRSGKGGKDDNIVARSDFLSKAGITVIEADRGGDVTYHGPGQLVGYPIFNLNNPPHQPDLHRYLRSLEEALIRTLSHFDIDAGRIPPHTGVWVNLDTDHPLKIAAIGIKASRWITSHGFALNICPNMQHFEHIIPCGIRDYGVTSMEQYLNQKIRVDELRTPLEDRFLEVFGLNRSV